MSEESDPEATLRQWEAEMRAEREADISDPDPDADHRIEGIEQINYRLYYEYDEETGTLERARTERVNDLSDPELRSCSCGVRGMTPAEAVEHVEAARER